MKIIIDTMREGYSMEQVGGTMTAGELIDFLSDYEPDTEVYLGFDNRYTFGSIRESMVSEEYDDED